MLVVGHNPQPRQGSLQLGLLRAKQARHKGLSKTPHKTSSVVQLVQQPMLQLNLVLALELLKLLKISNLSQPLSSFHFPKKRKLKCKYLKVKRLCASF